MSFSWFVSRRYLRSKRKQKLISLITIISIMGVSLGVMALIVVISVFTGFTEGLRNQIIGINAHAIVQEYGSPIFYPDDVKNIIEKTDGVVAATPYISTQVLISSPYSSSGISVRGINPGTVFKVLAIKDKISEGFFAELENKDTIVLGAILAQRLQVGVGDMVKLISPNGSLSPMGVLPRVKNCRIVAIFKTNMNEYDANLAFVNLDTARSLSGIEQGVDGFEVKVADVNKAAEIAAGVQKKLGDNFLVRDWMRLNENLFAALQLEKAGIFIALNLIILVAALNIISALVMLVMEKKKDIAILKAMGAPTNAIMKIFLYQGMVIGAMGTVIGTASGLALCWFLKTYPIIELPKNVYPMSTMPVQVVWSEVTIIVTGAFIITLLATIYPSWKAAKVKPADTLAHE